MMNYVKRVSRATRLMLLFAPFVLASNNTNRWIPVLERPESYVFQNHKNITTSVFYAMGSTADKRGGGKAGIPELWGNYDLKDVMASCQAVKGIDPLAATGNTALANRSLRFGLSGKIEAVGLLLQGQYPLGSSDFWLGLRLPVFSVRTATRFNFVPEEYNPVARGKADAIRRYTHDLLGFTQNNCTRSGLGDLDLSLGWHRAFDHILLTRSIDASLQAGLLLPTGLERNQAIPTSIPLGSDGHEGMYFDAVAGVELKQDLTVGLMLGFTHLFSHTKDRRLSVDKEPSVFSALIGSVRVEPGFSFKCSPFIELGNLTDGLDFQARYTYLRHEDDNWFDVRADKTKASYLQGTADLIAAKKGQTRWRAHYASFSLRYDTAAAMDKIMFAPRFFISYDMPMNGSAFAKVHAVQVSAELQF